MKSKLARALVASISRPTPLYTEARHLAFHSKLDMLFRQPLSSYLSLDLAGPIHDMHF